jgi:hypothetical protein
MKAETDILLKIFLIYLGVFFAVAITFFMLAKSFVDQFGGDVKAPLIFGCVSAILVSVLAYATTHLDFSLFTEYWVFTGIFLLAGIVHAAFFHEKYFFSNDYNKVKVTVGEILYMLALLILVLIITACLLYFFGERKFLFSTKSILVSMLVFFIPLVFQATFKAAYNIPSGVFPTWEYPLNNPIELPDEKPNEKLLVIAFEICKKASDTKRTNFRAKGPETMKMGDLFYHFINDYNDTQSETPIQYAADEYSPHEWAFRVKPSWFRSSRVLDPELTVRENKIRENAVIICERFSKT